MVHKNKYINRSKISEAKFREIISYFVADLSATQVVDHAIGDGSLLKRGLMIII